MDNCERVEAEIRKSRQQQPPNVGFDRPDKLKAGRTEKTLAG
jgi:hypothetical protein